MPIVYSIKYATFLLATWCYYSDKEINEKNEPIEIIDTQKASLNRAAKQTTNDWTAFLKQAAIFGTLSENVWFSSTYTTAVQSIYKEKNIRKLRTPNS